MRRLASDQSPAQIVTTVANPSDAETMLLALERPELLSHALTPKATRASNAIARAAGVEPSHRALPIGAIMARAGIGRSSSAGGTDSLGSRKRSVVRPTRKTPP